MTIETSLREALNSMTLDGHINVALNAILQSREPDGVQALLTELAHIGVNRGWRAALSSKEEPIPESKEKGDLAGESKDDRCAWRPMDTAPKDGTHILIARDHGEDVGPAPLEITKWCVLTGWHYEQVGDNLYSRVPDVPTEFWNGNGHRATHWMPLPPPPVNREASR